MNQILEMGKKFVFQIRYVRENGEGIAFADDGRIVLIEGVNEGDYSVNAEIIEIWEKMVIARKINRIRSETRADKAKGGIESPYEVDDGEPFNDEEDPEEFSDDDEEES